jgi:hypothetical protein
MKLATSVSKIAIASVASLLIATTVAGGYATINRPIEMKVRDSDVVVVGLVVIGPEKSPFFGSTHERVRVLTTLKGQPGSEIWFESSNLTPELSPDCCDVGGEYVFFLSRIRDDEYMSVDGRYGVYKVRH